MMRDWLRPNALRFSCRLAALANADELRVVVDSKTQNSSDLARRKAVDCNRLFGGSRTRDGIACLARH